MPAYSYQCPNGHTFTLIQKYTEFVGGPVTCPQCHAPAPQLFEPKPVVWHTDGSHNGDYGKGNKRIGTKIDALNKKWSAHTGESPPPAAPDVPTNSGEMY